MPLTTSSERGAATSQPFESSTTSSKKAAQHQPTLPPPFVYENSLSYAVQWKKEQQQSSASQCSSSTAAPVLFDLAFINGDASNDQRRQPLYLVACTGTGELCIWDMPPVSSRGGGDDDDDDDNVIQEDVLAMQVASSSTSMTSNPTNARTPKCRFQVPGSPTLYSLEIVKQNQQYWIIAAGDGGVYLYDWEKDIVPMMNSTSLSRGSSTQNRQEECKPRSRLQLYPSAYERHIEVNDTCWHKDGFVYGAAGDAFGCYKWNVETEQIVTTYRQRQHSKNHCNSETYLQAVEQVPGTNLILTGGEEGMLGVWDTSKDQLVDQIDISSAIHMEQTQPQQQQQLEQQRRRPTNSATLAPSRWISNIVARDENWWTVGGGTRAAHGVRQPSSSSTTTTTGFLATWHGPTRSLVTSVETRERPQQLALLDNNNNNNNNDNHLLSVGNESWVSHYTDPLSLSVESSKKVWCHAPSAYAVQVASDGRIAVAGVGGVVDIYENSSQLTVTLRL